MLLLVILFIVVPLAELYVIIQVGSLIGALPTIAILLADSLLGAMLLGSQGRAAWSRFSAALAEGRMPHREIVDGALVIVGGALLLTPGFLTDGAGLLLLIPPTRVVARKALIGFLAGRVSRRGAAVTGVWSAGARFRRTAGGEVEVYEGDAIEVPAERLPEGPDGPDGDRPRDEGP